MLTIEDILETVFHDSPSRVRRLLNVEPVTKIEDSIWLVAGLVSLRRLSQELEIELPDADSVTLGGVVQDVFQKRCEKGDRCQWGPFDVRVIDMHATSGLLLELKLKQVTEDES